MKMGLGISKVFRSIFSSSCSWAWYAFWLARFRIQSSSFRSGFGRSHGLWGSGSRGPRWSPARRRWWRARGASTSTAPPAAACRPASSPQWFNQQHGLFVVVCEIDHHAGDGSFQDGAPPTFWFENFGSNLSISPKTGHVQRWGLVAMILCYAQCLVTATQTNMVSSI